MAELSSLLSNFLPLLETIAVLLSIILSLFSLLVIKQELKKK